MLTREAIAKQLQDMGLKKGDLVLVHSSTAALGPIEGGVETLVDAFLEVIGSEGTLLAPVFGSLGIFTVAVRNRPDAIISDCPKGTIAAIGPQAKYICEDHWRAATAHGEGTPYTKLAELSGYICLLGVDQDRNTSLHSVEALLELAYLRTVTEDLETPTGRISKTWKYYPGPHRDFIGLDKLMRDSGKMKIGKVGNAVTRLFRSRDMYEIMLAAGKIDPAFCLCDNPACDDCVHQRAALMAARLKQEDFKLTIASSVAGKYIPEMIDSLHASGCNYIELDIINGRPAWTLSAEQLADATAQLSAANIEVSALRLTAIPGDIDSVVDTALAAGIKTLIMPLSAEAKNHRDSANRAGMEVYFVNIGLSSVRAGELLNMTGRPGSVLNPLEFAKAGEHPFLTSYRIGKYQRTIRQLDFADGLYDGTPTNWAKGNGEVKELLSIIRCFSFNGFVSICGSNKGMGTPRELVKKFIQLLDEI